MFDTFIKIKLSVTRFPKKTILFTVEDGDESCRATAEITELVCIIVSVSSEATKLWKINVKQKKRKVF